MTALLIAARAVVSALIVILVGLAFLPREAACRLTRAQIFLGNEIERRRQ